MLFRSEPGVAIIVCSAGSAPLRCGDLPLGLAVDGRTFDARPHSDLLSRRLTAYGPLPVQLEKKGGGRLRGFRSVSSASGAGCRRQGSEFRGSRRIASGQRKESGREHFRLLDG